jgi:hypothetical protein
MILKIICKLKIRESKTVNILIERETGEDSFGWFCRINMILFAFFMHLLLREVSACIVLVGQIVFFLAVAVAMRNAEFFKLFNNLVFASFN